MALRNATASGEVTKLKKWNQRVTDKKCLGCGNKNVQKDKHENDILVCRTCGLKYKEIKCEICGSSAILDVHTNKEICKNCEDEV